MVGADLNSGYRLRFHSSSASPLAISAGQAISLGQYQEDVECLVNQLAAQGEVLITCSGRYAFSVALLASWHNGNAVILPNNHNENNLQAIRNDSAIIFECDEDWAAGLATFSTPSRHGEWQLQLPGEMLAARLYTSGSTGTPKAIDKSLSNLLDEAITLKKTFDWPAGPIVASVPPQHMYGLTFSVLLPWVSGRAWVNDSPFFAQDVTQLIHDINAGTLISVPAQYKALLESSETLPDTRCVSAAAALPAEVARRWQLQQGQDILEIYGSTETGVVGFRQLDKSANWTPLPQVKLSQPKDDGRLLIKSPFTSFKWEEGFLSADRVNLHNDHSFELLGRADSVIKIAGKRISLAAIEHALLELPAVADAAVIAVSTDQAVRDKAIWAVVVAKEDNKPSPRTLQQMLRSKLDSIAIPRRIVFTHKLPRSANGKLPRAALFELFSSKDEAHV